LNLSNFVWKAVAHIYQDIQIGIDQYDTAVNRPANVYNPCNHRRIAAVVLVYVVEHGSSSAKAKQAV
jgi:hypothetical protein